MALTLTANIDDDQSTFLVSGTVPDAIAKGYLFRVGDEILRLRGFEGVLPPFPYPVNRNHWRAERGHGGSVAASHTAGASILGARDAWTSGDDEGQPDPFDEVLESLPIATSDVTGLDTALATIPADASELTVSPAVAGESDVQGALEALPRWRLLKSITAAEFNAAFSGNSHIDLAVVPTGSILSDIGVRVSADYNDSAGWINMRLGWDVAGTPRWLGPSQTYVLQVYPDDWTGVSGILSGSQDGFQVPAMLPGQASVTAEYGLPAFVKDAVVAGSLQAVPDGVTGDATLGTIEVWALIQEGAF